MTIGELLTLYQTEHLSHKVTAKYYGRLIRQLFPPIAGCSLEQLDVRVVLSWWSELADRPGHANKALGLLRASTRWASGLGLISSYPQAIAGIKKRPERTRCTTTSPEEWARLMPWLEDLRLKHRVYFWAVYLLGSRPGEVRMMRPTQLFLDREQPIWAKPTTKTGRPHIVPLPTQLVPMLQLLICVNPPGCPWMFWGERADQMWGRTSAQKMWEGIRTKVGLSHLWLNDLRRSTASDLLNQGASLGVVQGALNHRSLSVTARYAYLAVAPLAQELQKRADRILEHG